MNIKYILISTIVFIVSQILIWYQLNSQLVWKWAEGYKSMIWMSLLGSLWSVRFMGFATSMMVFPIMTYFYLGEPMTLKVIATLILALIIMILQLI